MSAGQGSKDARADWAVNIRPAAQMTWCPEFAHGWYDAVYASKCCPRCNPESPAKPKKASGSVALNWLWCRAQGHGWYEGITRHGFFRDCDKCAREASASGGKGKEASS
ncbi:hypothetical protein G6O67_000458 [Ophiocordyceps sinensis]|uniref:Uncharacterized protein n=2 Tax=Ophiocordyceps sinensis TaxID=72228 RepID=A0A8H4PZF3_9HYPO|nr:hypothetical protein OCS_00311 [Ophiocordyceps sinensis CO18]KAF4513150.1 hypothetical protein G6O67_000458 [Ophiocordyceps sinensis]